MPRFVCCLLLLRLPAIKIVENRLLFPVRDARPVVRHPKPYGSVPAPIDPQLDRTSLRRIADRSQAQEETMQSGVIEVCRAIQTGSLKESDLAGKEGMLMLKRAFKAELKKEKKP